MSNQNQMLKDDVIRMSKTILSQIPFNTIYSYADNLFDLQEVPFNDPSIQKQIDLLKSTKLSDIEYLDIDKLDFFTMTNLLTGEAIQVSNRMSSRGELRGEKLRDFLNQQKQETPNEVAYDTITRAIRTAECSDMVTMLKGTVSSGEGAKITYGTPISNEHFELFTSMLLVKVQEKIQNKELTDTLEPRTIRDDIELHEEIWKGIDIVGIYDATQALTLQLKQIKDKGDELVGRGCYKAGKAASDLYNDLTAQKISLIQGKLPVQDFSQNCNRLIEESQKGELQNHRGFFGKIWHGLMVALNILTFGTVAITPTTSIQKTMKMKFVIQNFLYSHENKLQELPEESPKVSL